MLRQLGVPHYKRDVVQSNTISVCVCLWISFGARFSKEVLDYYYHYCYSVRITIIIIMK